MAKDNAQCTIHNAQRKYIDAEMFANRIEASPAFGNMAFEGELLQRVVLDLLGNAPAADVMEVKHGEWIYKHRHRGGFERRTAYDEFNNPHTVTLDNRYECDEPYCSVCGKLGGDFLNYCGNCGAKMDGGKAE